MTSGDDAVVQHERDPASLFLLSFAAGLQRAAVLSETRPPPSRHPAEALAEIEQAIEAWLTVAHEDGLPIPEPRYRAPTRIPALQV
jgi:hypothetical protein